MLRLFHVSEEPGISLFKPRPVPSPDAGVAGKAVWAIDEEHLPNYLLPRDCPRVTYACSPSTTARDRAGFFDDTDARRIIVIEQAWLERALNAVLYVYEMTAQGFHAVDASAGYYASRSEAMPLDVRRVANPLAEIHERDCQIRLVPDLHPIRDAVVASTLDYSIIRMRNAIGSEGQSSSSSV